MTRENRYKSFKRRCKRMGFCEEDFEEMALVIPEDLSTAGERISLKQQYETSGNDIYELVGFKGKSACLINVDTEKELLVKPQVALRGIFSYYVLNREDVIMSPHDLDLKIENLRKRLSNISC